ncbi:CHAT domain-containing protein [Acrocarpospora corrugata]|uniref:CHAT domain-containing protein n=1 Tax=Acrocarpospora corrugata TaxID=35763 RepID=A0A5M3VZM7_9ACTN|nr:CHAT domain-containing protein [Acrocarpospora corrugata]GES02327.1 CHAT domain-containing protein [Acrocarpospora corrugata]
MDIRADLLTSRAPSTKDVVDPDRTPPKNQTARAEDVLGGGADLNEPVGANPSEPPADKTAGILQGGANSLGDQAARGGDGLDGGVDPLVVRAVRAVELAGRDPRAARVEAEAVLEVSGRGRQREAASIALRGMALAVWELGDLPLADELLSRAAEEAVGLPGVAAQAGMSQVPLRALLGDPEAALELADRIESDLVGLDRCRLEVQRAVPLVLVGRHLEAAAGCTAVIPALVEDPRFHAGALLNRGLAYVFLERFGEAVADLTCSAEVAKGSGLSHLAMLAEGNLPFAAARRGDIPAAFESYQAAEHSLLGFPERLAAMRTDFAQALVAARLPNEARSLLEKAVPVLAASNAQVALSDARLLLAQVELLTGDPFQAQQTAETAHAELLDQGRSRWAPLATDIVLRARLAQADQPAPAFPGLLADLYACADDLVDTGWHAQADSLRLLAGRTAKRLEDREAATVQLSRLLDSRTRPVVRHHAQAALHHMNGEDSAAMASVEAGIGTFLTTLSPTSDQGIDGPMIVGAAEIRAHAVRGAEDLAAFGLELALLQGDGRAVLTWAERWRSVVRGDFTSTFTRRPTDNVLTIGPDCLVEYVRHEDELFAVVAQDGDCELHAIGSYAEIAEATIRIRYQLRRRNLRDAGPGCTSMPEAELAALDAVLLGPLHLKPGPMIVVPTGSLHTLPWPLLPSLRGCPLSVNSHAGGTPPRSEPNSLVIGVAGPGLIHALDEVRAIAQTHQNATTIPANKEAVIEALGSAAILHIAAHGMFSPRSPMLSSIALTDGPLMAYELLRVTRVPPVVVLSACEAGMAHAPMDGIAWGLAGAFLEQGAKCVIAGVVPVRDEEALVLMRRFHELLATGHSPAQSLATAALETDIPGFACFGTGN